MQSAGGDFSWSGNTGPQEYCLGHYLSQCNPDARTLPGVEQYINPVGPIWFKVSQAVMGEMHNPYSSDEVRFRGDDLRLRLGLSLRTVPRH